MLYFKTYYDVDRVSGGKCRKKLFVICLCTVCRLIALLKVINYSVRRFKINLQVLGNCSRLERWRTVIGNFGSDCKLSDTERK
jgi:hypothetical protein